MTEVVARGAFFFAFFHPCGVNALYFQGLKTHAKRVTSERFGEMFA
jgi:hypothetical protein